MKHNTKKLVAAFIAIWLPLFGGNALAVSVSMQAMNGDGYAMAVQEGEYCPHHASAAQQTVFAGDPWQSAGLQGQQDSSCGGSGICHVGCCGFMVTAAIKLAVDQPFALSFAPSSNQFQSITLTPLDPPPLARA